MYKLYFKEQNICDNKKSLKYYNQVLKQTI